MPATFADMGANAIAFIKALGLTKVDVLGFSIGGFVAQEITLATPDLVRRLVLVGTAPRGGEGMEGGTPEGQPHLRRELRPALSPLAQRFLHAIGPEPGGGLRVSRSAFDCVQRIAIPK